MNEVSTCVDNNSEVAPDYSMLIEGLDAVLPLVIERDVIDLDVLEVAFVVDVCIV